ncbi:beta-N-acetylhexosaminidase [Variovorax dokdonensis]|uniref:Beta-hexosaminidase n=1 Tax=Variovorax dokdonensis TaxID=344883 RepID=A0ABT7N6K5_9BURK|nr:beta-N-acetylhexosaminidase [Variovorax dokdonensis]MDM0043573.1 beta-N-acetylhexosaminidase [Variovorax dokdonensis]
MNRQTHHSPLVIDVAGTALSDADRRRIQDPMVGGVIHFARNWKDRAALSALNREIKALRPDMLICVDQEGGRVQRFRTDGFARLPAMRALGQLWMSDAMQAVRAATACGFVMAAELRACGVDFSFAPVLDLDHGGSGVIGDRSFHRDPRVVALLAKSVAHGMLQAGMASCGKHFPGHGFVKADSHVAIPVDRRSLKVILADDARPFEWMSGTLPAVMPAHVIYAKVDGLPAGFSPRWLREILRGKLGFEGVIFSDDLNMEAARHLKGEQLGFADAALTALAAGCDMALLCNRSVGDGAVLDAFLHDMTSAARDGRWQPDRASESRRRALLPVGPAPEWAELHDMPIYRRAAAQVQALAAQVG